MEYSLALIERRSNSEDTTNKSREHETKTTGYSASKNSKSRKQKSEQGTRKTSKTSKPT